MDADGQLFKPGLSQRSYSRGAQGLSAHEFRALASARTRRRSGEDLILNLSAFDIREGFRTPAGLPRGRGFTDGGGRRSKACEGGNRDLQGALAARARSMGI
jgi:hypothetical protein